MYKKISIFCWIIFSIFSISFSTQANTNAWNFFSQGTAPSTLDLKKSASIQVLSEKLSIEFTNTGKTFDFPKTPSFLEYFPKHNLPIPDLSETNTGITTSMLGVGVDRITGKYEVESKNTTNVHVIATYTMKNISAKSLQVDSGFSFFDRLSSTSFGYDPYCVQYLGISDSLLPQAFSVKDNKGLISSKREYISKNMMSPCIALTKNGSDYDWINKDISWILPVERYTLSFNAYETKSITMEYDIHAFNYGAEYLYSDVLFYDFAPIFSWGNGVIPKVDIQVIAPRDRTIQFTHDKSYTGASAKLDGYYNNVDHGIYANTNIPAITPPSSVKILSNNRIQQSYFLKNLNKNNNIDTLLFTFFNLPIYRNMNSVGLSTKTFWLSCTLPSKKKQIFKNNFPGGIAEKAGDFIGYEYQDTGKGILVTKYIFPYSFLGKTTLLPSGTKCEKN